MINVINLERRDKRRISLMNHLDEMGCLYKFWRAYEHPNQMPFECVAESHKMIVRDAKQRGLDSVLIAEDDLRFSSKKSLDYFMSNVPDKYDLFFGMIYTGTIQDRRITHGFSGLQFYSIHQRFYDTFLSAPPKKHLDVWLGMHCHENLYYVSDPFICGAASGFSDNFNRQWTFEESKLPRNLLKDDPILQTNTE